ncbi:23S rRNA (adenine(2503)-C(2))-methyltransferase RlmN [Erysipelothrix urinaevulpis]|uniref:23S rRNA (adenine(2503)-C(2))-methyltransferase RlmN n=1 Tax=Erysipelothrix urinaevulpis TaxID=2683717 RepID=UPI00135692F4|nr:23S rRNA (adenine(2503)-C(2))-methyltransferase RlmN [Erysipelothrix urinaevulpis]
MKSIYNYDLKNLEIKLTKLGEKPFRAKQVFSWLYEKRVDSFDEMTNLSFDLREKLKENFVLNTLKLVKQQTAADETSKYLLECEDGALIETVLMKHDYGYSVCVTSQVGCAMGCKFCASGLLKAKRNLSAGELVNQIMFVQKDLDKREKRVSHIVVMGIGEPFMNYPNVMEFIACVNNDKGLNIGARHITISTCGIAPVIKRFADEMSQVNLAISLHAPNDALRSQIMPVNDMFNLEELFEALHYYQKKSNRRLTFEYILIDGVNDTLQQAKELVELVKSMNAYVNLIPYNEVEENPFRPTQPKNAAAFYDYLKRHNVQCVIRREKGSEIDAACGQLRANVEKQRSARR